MSYIPNTDDDRRKMLNRIGVSSIEDLLDTIPDELRLKKPLDIPKLSELELLREIDELAHQNKEDMICFAGGGVYDHFIPSAIGTILSRPEFATAYTPYQSEVSQGTLQVIYEFQTHICRLTGMDVANASMYDGASAAAEAISLAVKSTRRKRAAISETVSPMVREVISTYLSGTDIEQIILPMKNGRVDQNEISALDNSIACVLIAQPNFFGCLEEIENIEEKIHSIGGLLIMSVDPIAQALLKTPGEYKADIAVGEGQPLGIPLSYGGPLLGFFAASTKLMRNLPGRIAGRTQDIEGKTGYTLILQTREQHIRREKATSNICTNQALCATTATVYMTLMGKAGLRKAALLSAEKAQQAAKKINEIDGFSLYFDHPFVREFAVKTPKPASQIIENLLEHQILAGIDASRWYRGYENCLIMAFTEKRSIEDIECFINSLKELSANGVLSRM